jgi:hypothetical protein
LWDVALLLTALALAGLGISVAPIFGVLAAVSFGLLALHALRHPIAQLLLAVARRLSNGVVASSLRAGEVGISSEVRASVIPGHRVEQLEAEVAELERRLHDAQSTRDDAVQLREYKRANREIKEREARVHRAVDTLLTWLYRRQNWFGLTADGRTSEPAPWDIWAKRFYEVLDLRGLKYEPPSIVGVEPGYKPPLRDPELIAIEADGTAILDELRRLRKDRESEQTREDLQRRYREWDRRTEKWVLDNHGAGYWITFSGDDGRLSYAFSEAFSNWAQEIADGVDRRLARLRWLESGKVGLM